MTKDVLYYDGACQLCNREMKHLESMKRETLELVDIHSLPNTENVPDMESLLTNLHLRRGDEWLTGADANVAAWQHTRIGFAWRWLRWPLIRHIVDPVYAFWARKRYDGLYGDRAEAPEKSQS